MGEQQVELDRLDRVPVEAGIESALSVRVATVAGQREQDDRARPRVGAQRRRELVAVHPRQADVEDRHLRNELVD